MAIERSSPEKHEFLEGEIYVMAGGSENHSRLIGKLAQLLNGIVGDDGPCYAFASDMRFYVEAVDLATFPDASVICGPLRQHEPSPIATALNPTILFEVTSDSSEEYDLGAKREFYQTIPTLREYIVVSHRARRVIFDLRDASDKWVTRIATGGQRVELPSLRTDIAVDDIYRNSTIA